MVVATWWLHGGGLRGGYVVVATWWLRGSGYVVVATSSVVTVSATVMMMSVVTVLVTVMMMSVACVCRVVSLERERERGHLPLLSAIVSCASIAHIYLFQHCLTSSSSIKFTPLDDSSGLR